MRRRWLRVHDLRILETARSSTLRFLVLKKLGQRYVIMLVREDK